MKILTFDIEDWFHLLDTNLTERISDFNFIDIRTADSEIKWDSVQNVRI